MTLVPPSVHPSEYYTIRSGAVLRCTEASDQVIQLLEGNDTDNHGRRHDIVLEEHLEVHMRRGTPAK